MLKVRVPQPPRCGAKTKRELAVAGCSYIWLLSFEQAKESNSLVARKGYTFYLNNFQIRVYILEMVVVKMISFHIPENNDVLAALGEVALRHEQMNHILKMTVKSLANLTPEEALAATKYESSRQLRDKIKKLARKRLGEGAPLLKLQAIITNCENLTDMRNELVHGLWARELDGDAHIRDSYGNTRPLPDTQELKVLAKKIEQLTNQLNFERLEGFLKQALID